MFELLLQPHGAATGVAHQWLLSHDRTRSVLCIVFMVLWRNYGRLNTIVKVDTVDNDLTRAAVISIRS